MKLTSSAFEEGEKIPYIYTYDGNNMNPPLEIEDVPSQAKSLVLIVDDPDVPESVRKDRMWVHWVVFDMPVTAVSIAQDTQPPGVPGKNTAGDLDYQGPCPPDREHRYFFKVYALDTLLNLPKGATKEQLEKAMQGHVLASAQLMGRYERVSRF
jgi:Raf kinase inhibitor-like YbhB/YbcL family protein